MHSKMQEHDSTILFRQTGLALRSGPFSKWPVHCVCMYVPLDSITTHTGQPNFDAEQTNIKQPQTHSANHPKNAIKGASS